MANLKDLAIQLATTNLVADLVAEHKDKLRAEMADAFNELGSDSVKVSVGDDKIGKVSLVEPKAKAVVINEKQFLDWVELNRPNEIVKQVRESFKKWVLDNVEFGNDGTAFLTESGEVVDGVEQRKSTAYVSTRFESDGREKLTNAIKRGKIVFDLPAVAPNQIEE